MTVSTGIIQAIEEMTDEQKQSFRAYAKVLQRQSQSAPASHQPIKPTTTVVPESCLEPPSTVPAFPNKFYFSEEQLLVQQLRHLSGQKRVLSNEEIDQICDLLAKQNQKRPSVFAEGEFTVPDNFNDPLPSEIMDSFYES